MAIKEIKKIYLLGYREIEGDLIHALQELGVVEVARLLPETDGAGEPPDVRGLERKLEQIEYCVNLLGRYPPAAGRSGGGKVLLSREEFRDIVRHDDLEEVHRACRELDQRRGELKARRTRLEGERREFLPWQPLASALSPLDSGGAVLCRPGQLPLNRYAAFAEALAERTDLAFIHPVGSDHAARYLLLFLHREQAAAVEEIGRDHEFSPLAHGSADRTPGELLHGIDRALVEVTAEEHRVIDELRSLYPRRARLAALRDHYANLLAGGQARRFLSRTASSFCLTGWIPMQEAARVKSILSERFSSLAVLLADPSPADQVPVLLQNGPVVHPFEVVTDLYGRPHYRGVDPTPFLAVFFATFFGFCLTDAGYGLVLMALSAFMLSLKSSAGATHFFKIPIPSEGARQFYRLFFLGGVATVVLGAVVGTWFGVTVSWKLFDALGDLFVFFGLALGLGILHLLTGLSIKMVRSIRSGDWASGVCDQGLWMLMLLALSGLGLAMAKLLPAGWLKPAQFLSLAAALGIVFFQGRGADKTAERYRGLSGWLYECLWVLLTLDLSLYLLKMARPATGIMALTAVAAILVFGFRTLGGVLGRVGLGLYSLYGISGFLGDTLSYSRLVALGLSTGIVGMIVNKMAGLALGAPFIGWPLAAFILVGGHAFNLVINLLGAFVHSCRLQYVEFFTKFYEAGGRPFRPFCLEHRFTVLND